MTVPGWSTLLKLLAFVLLLVAALLAGGLLTGSGWEWLIPGGLAAWVLSELVP